MRNLILGLSLSVAFIVGCVAGGVGQRLVAPPARAGTSPKKWETHCFQERGSTEMVNAKANKMGQQGWEFVDGNGSFYCFKRPL
jgi:hypothetical protein